MGSVILHKKQAYHCIAHSEIQPLYAASVPNKISCSYIIYIWPGLAFWSLSDKCINTFWQFFSRIPLVKNHWSEFVLRYSWDDRVAFGVYTRLVLERPSVDVPVMSVHSRAVCMYAEQPAAARWRGRESWLRRRYTAGDCRRTEPRTGSSRLTDPWPDWPLGRRREQAAVLGERVLCAPAAVVRASRHPLTTHVTVHLQNSRRTTDFCFLTCDTIHTIRDAIWTCTRKPTQVSLIYRRETTKPCKTEKTKKKENGYAQK